MPTELDRFITAARAARGALFAAAPVTVARAPGWVDLMGGAGAPGGALALGWPLGPGSFVALQPLPQRTLLVHESAGQGQVLNLGELEHADGSPREYADAAARLADRPFVVRAAGAAWLALMREEFARFPGGAVLLAQQAAGPGASDGLAAAVAQAIVSAFRVHLAPRELAYVVHVALDRVAGHNPGDLGALVAVCGHAGGLLQVHQQPRWVWGELHLPHGAAIWAITLGYSPPPEDASRLVTATAMAYAIVAEAAGPGRAAADARWLGYLANMGTPSFEAGARAMLPERLSGAAFVERYGPAQGLTPEPDYEYPVRAAAALAVEEHLRSRMVAALLRAAASKAQRDEDLALAGELMARSHGAQRAAGLGDPRADALVERIYAQGAGHGVYGARMAVADLGTTIVALGRADAEPTMRAIVDGYEREAGLPAAVWGGTSAGASIAGTREL